MQRLLAFVTLAATALLSGGCFFGDGGPDAEGMFHGFVDVVRGGG